MRAALSFVLLLCGLCVVTQAGESTRGESQMIVHLRSGAYVAFSTGAEPHDAHEPPASFVESEGEPNLVRRIFLDGRGQLFFGYELTVEPAGATATGARQFRVSVRPLAQGFLRQLAARPSFAGRRLHPGYNPAAFDPKPQTIGDGDTFALDVLRNPRTGAKLLDLVKVTSEDPRRRGLPASSGPPRDFNAEGVRLQMNGYALSVNDEVIHRSKGSCSGPLIWFSLPGRGRFIVSLVPRSGYDFRQAGTIEHDRITFEWDGERYEWASSGPVVGTGGNWKVWVLHDPGFDFDLTDAPARTTAGEELEQKIRRAARTRDRAEFDNQDAREQPQPKRRVRVVVGAAESIEWLMPSATRPRTIP